MLSTLFLLNSTICQPAWINNNSLNGLWTNWMMDKLHNQC
jgi:hypothetical protein